MSISSTFVFQECNLPSQMSEKDTKILASDTKHQRKMS